VLKEALRDGPDEEKIPSETKVLRTQAGVGRYRAAIQVTDVSVYRSGGARPYRYIDKGWRIRDDASDAAMRLSHSLLECFLICLLIVDIKHAHRVSLMAIASLKQKHRITTRSRN